MSEEEKMAKKAEIMRMGPMDLCRKVCEQEERLEEAKEIAEKAKRQESWTVRLVLFLTALAELLRALNEQGLL